MRKGTQRIRLSHLRHTAALPRAPALQTKTQATAQKSPASEVNMAPGDRAATNMADHTKARADIRLMTYTIIPTSTARGPISKAGIEKPPLKPPPS